MVKKVMKDLNLYNFSIKDMFKNTGYWVGLRAWIIMYLRFVVPEDIQEDMNEGGD